MKRPSQSYAQQVTRVLAERDELERKNAAKDAEIAKLKGLLGIRDQNWRDVRAAQIKES